MIRNLIVEYHTVRFTIFSFD